MTKKDPNRLHDVHTRLFADDVSEIKRTAQEKGVPWQIELRLLVRKALKAARLDVIEVTPPGGKS